MRRLRPAQSAYYDTAPSAPSRSPARQGRYVMANETGFDLYVEVLKLSGHDRRAHARLMKRTGGG